MTEASLAFFIKECTTAGETLVGVVEQSLLLGCEAAVVKVYLTDAVEQTLIKHHIVVMLGEQGLDLLGKCIQLVGGLGTEKIEENG